MTAYDQEIRQAIHKAQRHLAFAEASLVLGDNGTTWEHLATASITSRAAADVIAADAIAEQESSTRHAS